MTRRQHMIMAWALIALVRGILYTPVHPGYGDFPLPLTFVFDEQHVWITGMVWFLIAALGVMSSLWVTAPWWVEQLWWIGILGGVAGWGGMYISGAFIPGGYFGLVAAGALYLAVAYGMWATKGHPPIPASRRRPSDSSTNRGI